jgi:hypothetical protein
MEEKLEFPQYLNLKSCERLGAKAVTTGAGGPAAAPGGRLLRAAGLRILRLQARLRHASRLY